MWGFEESRDAHQQVYSDDFQPQEHEAKFSHEMIGGAAAFAGMKVWEDRQRAEGKPVSHAFAKEALMGLVGMEVDKLAETKGMDEYDREKAKHHAKQSAQKMYEDHYERGYGADQYDPNQYDQPNFNY
uniref:CipC-like antibiotic response protein n=1 Tax=Araucaria cunninghamii TaxID=56994 RepID=A0A0D6R9V4_ARACU